jgi:hypothetical protein
VDCCSNTFQDNVPENSTKRTIASWFKRFIETGSVAHTKYGQGRPGVADDVAERVRRSYERHLLASRELHIPRSTVWKILRKRLKCKPYRVQLLQAFKDGYKVKRFEFCGDMINRMEDNDD